MLKQARLPLLLAFSLGLLFSCSQTQRRAAPMPESVSAYVYAHTSGIISKADPIRIRFASAAATDEQIGQEATGILQFSPSIAGQAVWEDPQTLRYEPEAPLQSGQAYVVSVQLKKIFPQVPKEAESFEFDFRTRDQALEVFIEGLHSPNTGDLSKQEISGILYTFDVAEQQAVEQTLSAQQDGRSLPIRWAAGQQPNEYRFHIQEVARKEKTAKVDIKWDGKPINTSIKGSEVFEVPALSEFKLMNVRVVQGQERYLELFFSDPLSESQDFNGMVSIDNFNGSLRVLPDGNQLRVYPSGRLLGNRRLLVSQGLKNAAGRSMTAAGQWDISIEDIKPQVRLVGKGSILPSSEGLVFPFEAINLTAVEVEVFKIYHNNILQFLQNNELSSGNTYNLSQVGRVILQTKVPLQSLNPNASTAAWSRYALKLDELIEQDPQAIYQIRIGFRPEYSNYFCGEAQNEREMEQRPYEEGGEIRSFMDNWYGFSGYYEGYNWEDREDPCKPAYYNSERFVQRNILASNIGLLAKGGTENSCLVVATDLRSAKPISGAELEFYDYQQQLLASGSTDSKGMFTTQLPRQAFFIIAKQGEERGYLRLQDGDALSMSRFDVDGAVTQKGLKGFLYGDRGVWRPGDSVYLNFILEDKLGKLPPNYPISFELRDPRGQLQEQRTQSENANYIYPLHFATSADAPTGTWRATVKAGGATFDQYLRVETVKPNRIKVELDFGQESLSAAAEPLRPKLQANWLHGAPASGLKTIIEAELRSSTTQFEQFRGYVFDDPARRFSSTLRTVYEGTLDGKGQAQPEFRLANQQQLPGRLTASFKTRVFERSGDFSTDNYSLPYDPYTAYAGLKIPEDKYGSKRLNMNEAQAISFAATSKEGKPVAGRQLSVGLYRVQWRWWWDQDTDNISRYNTSTHYAALQKQQITTNAKGQADWKLTVDQWGRYLVRVCDTETGHCAGDFFYAGYPWYGDDDANYRAAAAMLSFTTDKQQYAPGETVTVKLPETAGGRIFLSVENGSRVLETQWADAKAGENEIKFTASKDMAPTAYAHVSLLQPHAQVDNDLPIRLYGVIPIKVEDPQTRLEPVVKAPAELKPKQSFSVSVSEKQGRPMAYTLAVVDEGLLSLTRFETPQPWDHFYAREALGVKTWDVYDEVLGAHGGQFGRLLGIGGDAAIVNPADQKANRFKPVAMHLGPFELKKGQTAKHDLQMPNYVGAVRVMVVAADQGAYGRAEQQVPVRQPLMVLGTLPRVLSPGEQLDLPVNVFAMKDDIRDVEVSVSAEGGLIDIENGSKRLRFTGSGDQLASIPIRVRERVGVAKFKITAKSGQHSASQEIEVQVRNPNPYVTEVAEHTLEKGQAHNFAFQPPGLPGTNEAMLEVSSIPPIDLGRHLDYLLRYPYGCLEQTLSGGFPQLYVNQLLELSEAQAARIPDHIRATIDGLKRFQISGGGFAYWPGNTQADQWATTYAGHFLLEAKSLGYNLPPGMIDQWAQHQKKTARLWKAEAASTGLYGQGNQALQQAYRLYTLALANQPDLAAMNRLRTYPSLNRAAKWRLAAAYALAGKPEAGRQLTQNLGTQVDNYRELSYTYGSALRDQAMILEALVLLEDQSVANSIAKTIAEDLSKARWLSTQETSFALLAMAKYAGQAKLGQQLTFSYTVDGQKVNAGSDKPIMQIQLPATARSVSLSNTSGGVLFARLLLRGQPAAGQENSSANQLEIAVAYKQTNGQSLDPTTLPQGTDFIAEVTVKQPGKQPRPYEELALSQIFPSGWEIVNTRMDNFTAFNAGSAYEYLDIRDDRVNTFFNLDSGNTKTYRVQLNAAYQGKFYLPATSCEAMYDQGINARVAGRWVEVGSPREI